MIFPIWEIKSSISYSFQLYCEVAHQRSLPCYTHTMSCLLYTSHPFSQPHIRGCEGRAKEGTTQEDSQEGRDSYNQQRDVYKRQITIIADNNMSTRHAIPARCTSKVVNVTSPVSRLNSTLTLLRIINLYTTSTINIVAKADGNRDENSET